MVRALRIIGSLLVAGGFLFSYFLSERGAGIPFVNIGLFVLVLVGLVEFFFGTNRKKDREKNSSRNNR
jgi:4-hydroxybenzoate polyprenyltransferase